MRVILVTGASGFVGQHLVRKLTKDSPGAVVCLHGHYPENRKMLMDITPEADVIYHVAGRLGKRGLPLSAYVNPHINMTRALVSMAKPGAHFVYISSVWTDLLNKDYEITKLAGEAVVAESCKSYSIVRPGFVIGENDQHHLPLYIWIKRLGRLFPVVGDGLNYIAPVYIHDLISYLSSPADGVSCAVSWSLTLNDFLNTIADALGVDRPAFHIRTYPRWMAGLLREDFFRFDRKYPVLRQATDLNTAIANIMRANKLFKDSE